VRTRDADGRTVVEVAGLDRTSRGDLAADVNGLVRRLQERHPPVDSNGPEQAEEKE